MAGKYEKLLSIKSESYELIDKEARALSLNLLRGLVLATPVDKGTARSNWRVSIDNPVSEVNYRYSSSVNAIKRGSVEIKSFLPAGSNEVLFIQNHMPYIERLNAGWSQQAPKKFVEQVINRVVNS